MSARDVPDVAPSSTWHSVPLSLLLVPSSPPFAESSVLFGAWALEARSGLSLCLFPTWGTTTPGPQPWLRGSLN